MQTKPGNRRYTVLNGSASGVTCNGDTSERSKRLRVPNGRAARLERLRLSTSRDAALRAGTYWAAADKMEVAKRRTGRRGRKGRARPSEAAWRERRDAALILRFCHKRADQLKPNLRRQKGANDALERLETLPSMHTRGKHTRAAQALRPMAGERNGHTPKNVARVQGQSLEVRNSSLSYGV